MARERPPPAWIPSSFSFLPGITWKWLAQLDLALERQNMLSIRQQGESKHQFPAATWFYAVTIQSEIAHYLQTLGHRSTLVNYRIWPKRGNQQNKNKYYHIKGKIQKCPFLWLWELLSGFHDIQCYCWQICPHLLSQGKKESENVLLQWVALPAWHKLITHFTFVHGAGWKMMDWWFMKSKSDCCGNMKDAMGDHACHSVWNKSVPYFIV